MLLLIILPLYADIDSRIDAIQKAPVEERFMLMNAFKKEIVHMQEEERIDAISKLKSITRSQHSDRALKELKTHARPSYTHRERVISKTKRRTEVHSERESEMEDHIESETEDHIENETEDHIESETEDHIENETEDHIENETEDHIEDETEEHIEDETEDHIEDEHDDD
ncbi:MAG: hypothetical protein ABF276_02745 [Sulfurovum sp.]